MYTFKHQPPIYLFYCCFTTLHDFIYRVINRGERILRLFRLLLSQGPYVTRVTTHLAGQRRVTIHHFLSRSSMLTHGKGFPLWRLTRCGFGKMEWPRELPCPPFAFLSNTEVWTGGGQFHHNQGLKSENSFRVSRTGFWSAGEEGCLRNGRELQSSMARIPIIITVGLLKSTKSPGLPGGSIIYQGHLLSKKDTDALDHSPGF